jgi:L-asparagine transporter-like permease
MPVVTGPYLGNAFCGFARQTSNPAVESATFKRGSLALGGTLKRLFAFLAMVIGYLVSATLFASIINISTLKYYTVFFIVSYSAVYCLATWIAFGRDKTTG